MVKGKRGGVYGISLMDAGSLQGGYNKYKYNNLFITLTLCVCAFKYFFILRFTNAKV